MTDQTMMDVLAKAPGQDEVLPFSVDALDVRGRVVHLPIVPIHARRGP